MNGYINGYADISDIEYYGIDNIHNPYSEYYWDNINNDYNVNIDNRCITSGINNIYEEEYYEHLKDFFSYMEYNEVYDY